jgi:microsomal dipeptidase-like Zn-dependent dipeptidase
MVTLAVNNKLLADMTRGPGDLPDDDKASADLQIAEIKAFVGRHSDFMQIAYNSSDLYNIVSQNKLAVIIGVEIDNIGNMTGDVPASALVAEVDRLYGEGVRYIFPVHLVDNPIGGAAAYEDLFNVANVYQEGHGYALGCADPTSNITYNYAPPSVWIAVGAFLKLGTNTPGFPPGVPCSTGNVNTRSLSPAGAQAIQEMMKKGMLIDVDHMSQASVNATIALAEGQRGGYPLNSGHNGQRGALDGVRSERSLTTQQYQQIGLLHGMAGVGSAKLTADKWLSLYSRVIQAMGPGAVAGFGTDINGLEFAMPPRPGSAVQYGTQAFPMQMSRDGNQSWDYNRVGVAHYGMLPDFMQDVASLPGGPDVINNMNNGAQYFYETWRMAEQGR